MPYPPPHGPPGESIFQGIGLLPEEGLPDQTGHAGDFLETDGTQAQWEPVSGSALPDQTGHAGQFLTTDGVNPSWAPVSGGLLPSMTGEQGKFLTNDGVSSAEWSIFTPINTGKNPVDYGAKMDGITDDAPAIQAALTAAIPDPTRYPVAGGVQLPPGIFYIGQPICITAPPLATRQASGVTFRGSGHHSTFIARHPTLLFQGPSIIANAVGPYSQGFTSGLVGGGQAMVFNNTPTFSPSILILSDSKAMSFQDLTFAAYSPTNPKCWNVGQFSFQTNLSYTIPVLPVVNEGYIASSRGTLGGQYSSSFILKFRTNPGGTNTGFLDATLVTENNSVTLSSLAPLSQSTKYNVELSYDGVHVGLWLEGVLQDSAAATGNIAHNEWETFTLGGSWDRLEGEGSVQRPFVGVLDSVRVSNTARHVVGGGNFTPPTSKYVFDANTMFLMNCDQGTSDYGFILCQGPVPSPDGAPSNGVPVIHYARFYGGVSVDWTMFCHKLQDFGMLCATQGPALIYNGHIISQNENIYINSPYRWGIRVGFNFQTFYDFYRQIHIEGGIVLVGFDSSNTGVTASEITVSTGYLQMNVAGASLKDIQLQGNGAAMGGIRIAPGGQGVFGAIWAEGLSTDNESQLSTNWMAPLLMDGSASQCTFTGCAFAGASLDQSAGKQTPVVLYNAQDWVGCRAVFDNCLFVGGSNYGFQRQPGSASPTGLGASWNPYLLRDSNNQVIGPLADDVFTVRETDKGQNTLIKGLSVTSVRANNLAGSVSVLHGFTSSSFVFLVPEPDANYDLVFTFKMSTGSAPAAGSTETAGYVQTAEGFTLTIGADPGGTCEVWFSWHLIRTERPPLVYIADPTVPSTVANPLAGTTSDFAVGATLAPAGGAHVLYFGGTGANQVIAAAGSPLGANSWVLPLVFGVTAGDGLKTNSSFVGTGDLLDSFVRNGRLVGLLNPGAHNVAFAVQNGGTAYANIVDGQVFNPSASLVGYTPLTQQTPIDLGQYSDTTFPLTGATLRHFKFDSELRFVTSTEPDIGPAPGDPQAAILGDGFTVGWTATTGGWASQLANTRFGTTYYWLAAAKLATSSQLLTEFWKSWGSNQTLTSICVFGGFQDLLGTTLTNGLSNTTVWSNLDQILNGLPASARMTPPSSNAAAWAEFVPPIAATATCVINGVSILSTFNTSAQQTAIDTAALINANGTLNLVVTATAMTEPHGNWIVFVQAIAPGFVGNAITTASNGANSAFWYPGPALFGGANATLSISGHTFDVLFDTDVNTTVNNTIAQIAGYGPVAALVTGTNVGGQLVITANTPGITGNAIGASTNGFGAALLYSEDAPAGGATSLAGGADGAIQKSIPNIILCTVPPFGDSAIYTAGKETERNALNTTIRAFVGAGVTIADVDVTLRDPGAHSNLNPAYLASDNTYVNDAGHTALLGLLGPLLP